MYVKVFANWQVAPKLNVTICSVSEIGACKTRSILGAGFSYASGKMRQLVVTNKFTAPKYSCFLFPLNNLSSLSLGLATVKTQGIFKNKLYVPEVKNVGNKEKTKKQQEDI